MNWKSVRYQTEEISILFALKENLGKSKRSNFIQDLKMQRAF